MAFKPVSSDFENDFVFTLLPAGIKASAIILDAVEKESKRGGLYLKLRVRLDDGEYEGRQIFDLLNIDVPGNEKATKIGRSEVAKLCKAAGLPEGYDNAKELVDRYINIKTTVKPAQGAYEASNGFRAIVTESESSKNDVKKEAIQKSADRVVEGSKYHPKAHADAVNKSYETIMSSLKPKAVDESDIPF